MMKTTILTLTAIAIFGSSSASNAGVTKQQLGQMLLGKNSVLMTQDYLNYLPGQQNDAGRVGGYHPGIDYRARQATNIYAPLNGVVERAGGSVGTLAIKKDGSDTRIILLHMSQFFVKPGDKVQTGCLIGMSGKTGSRDYHVHVEARVKKDRGAYYFANKSQTGVNKSPELIPPRYQRTGGATACKQ